ncbi:Amino-acid acetyltransferase, mitochondrial, partial [Ascosphaera acerosa]
MLSRDFFLHPLRAGKILVVPSIAYTASSPRAEPVRADDLLVALAKEFRGLQVRIGADEDPVRAADRVRHLQGEVALDRLIILDAEGGLPAPRRGSDRAHVFVNLEQEYQDIVDELTESCQGEDGQGEAAVGGVSDSAAVVSPLGRTNPLSAFAERE